MLHKVFCVPIVRLQKAVAIIIFGLLLASCVSGQVQPENLTTPTPTIPASPTSEPEKPENANKSSEETVITPTPPSLTPTPDGNALEALEVNDLRNRFQPQGFRALQLGSTEAFIPGAESTVLIADVSLEPELWSGVVLRADSATADWSKYYRFTVPVRWQNAENINAFALAFEDKSGNRWAWHMDSNTDAQNDGSWFYWDVNRDNATRKDAGFSWNSILSIYITGYATAAVKQHNATLEVGPIRGFENGEENAQPNSMKLNLQEAFPNLTFEEPVDLSFAPGDPDRLFLVERSGIIKVFPNSMEANNSSVFLDISDQVEDSYAEQGLLGLAFDPKYQQNGYFYVYYTASNPRRAIVSKFTVSKNDINRADVSKEETILSVPQPEPHKKHNAGQIRFGPDGFLYISIGEGGVARNAQDTTSLLGSILRIHVSSFDSNGKYSIPDDNPFAASDDGSKPEIWAYGFRNPWRFSFDRLTGDLWVGDVGAQNFEEINLVEPGLNYGWPRMEGIQCFQRARLKLNETTSEKCDRQGLELPTVTMHHSEVAVLIGGVVYHGAEFPSLRGKYLYGDFSTGKLWGMKYDGGEVVENEILFDNETKKLNISSIVEDESGELLFLSFQYGTPNSGQIYKIGGVVQEGAP